MTYSGVSSVLPMNMRAISSPATRASTCGLTASLVRRSDRTKRELAAVATAMLLVKLGRMRARLRRDLAPPQHPRQLVDAIRMSQRGQRARGPFTVARFRNLEMMIGVRRHLRQMRDAQHLPARAQRLQHAPDRGGDGTADAGVDFVEHERRHVAHVAGGDLYRQREP